MQYLHYQPPKQPKLDKAMRFSIILIAQVVIITLCMLASSSIGSYITNLITAVILALFSALIYFIAKRINTLRISNPILNSVAIGISIGVLYNFKGISLQPGEIIAPMAIVMLMIFMNNIILRGSKHVGWQVLINLLIFIAAIVVCILYWKNNIILCGQGLFLSIIYILSFFASIPVIKDKRDMWRVLSGMFFLVFVIIFLIVVAAVSEAGDILDGIGDIFSFDFSRTKKKG